jgi:hypothetical protein
MPWTDRGEGVSPVAIQLLGRALSSVPIDDLRQFVALMEAVESVPSPTARPRRAFDRSGRRRAHEHRSGRSSPPTGRPECGRRRPRNVERNSHPKAALIGPRMVDA